MAVAVAVAVAVGVGVNVAVALAVAVGVGVNLTVAVAVAVGVGANVAVGPGPGVRVGLGVGLRRLVGASDAWLKPCLPVSVSEKIPRGTWENVFPGIASSPAAQSRMPSEAGILKRRVPDCFRCAVKTRGLKKGNTEADFLFIWG